MKDKKKRYKRKTVQTPKDKDDLTCMKMCLAIRHLFYDLFNLVFTHPLLSIVLFVEEFLMNLHSLQWFDTPNL